MTPRQITASLTLLVFITVGLVGQTVFGDIILRVNISDPSAVTLTATGAFAEIDNGGTDSAIGITLLGLFANEYPIGQARSLSGDLTPSGAVNPFNSATNGFAGVSELDLNIYASGFAEPMNFSELTPALTGTATVNLSGASFLTFGSTGDIIVGDGGSGSGNAVSNVIGQFQVIPEPSSVALLAMVTGTLIFRRRREDRASS